MPLEERILLSIAPVVVTSPLDDGSVGTLRDAINQVNADGSGGVDEIDFNIPGTGPFVIHPLSPLPTIIRPTTIDGYSQPGSSANTKADSDDAQIPIQIDGSLVGYGNGLSLFGGGNTVRGLSITHWAVGLYLVGSGDVVAGNFIGVNPDGTLAGNSSFGVNAYGVSSETIGGSSPADRNVIGGSTHDVDLEFGSGNTIQGNFLGISPSGTSSFGDNVPLYEYSEFSDVIGGSAAGAGNVVASAPSGYGVLITSSSGTTVRGNLIGTNTKGTAGLAGGTSYGVFIQNASVTVGGTDSGDGNLISGNGVGVYATGGSVTLLQGNRIGTNRAGTGPLGNVHDGVILTSSVFSTIGGPDAGAGNTIAYNGGNGVVIGQYSGDFGSGNAILSNSIHDNGKLGIDLGNDGVSANDTGDGDSGPNGLQNYPALAAAVNFGSGTIVIGSLDSQPGTTYTLQFFTNSAADPTGHGEGQTLLGTTTVTTDAAGHADFQPNFAAPAGKPISATATDPFGNTSEFSADLVPVASASPLYAVADSYNTDVNTTLLVAAPGLRANDVTADGLPFTAKLVAGAAHGTATVNPDGSFSYVPLAGFTGTDSFTYRDIRGSLKSNVATVTITVNPKTLVVTNTNDSGPGSLRQALTTAALSNSPAADTIAFAIPGSGPFIINAASPLPAVSRPTIIDGYTQVGSAPNTLAVGDDAVILIQIEGNSSFDGLDLTGGGSTVRGLAIDAFTTAVRITGPGGNVIAGDYLGLSAAGASGTSNTNGVVIDGSNGNIVGGTDTASRDVIGGYGGSRVVITDGASGNLVRGSYLGTDHTGNPVGGYGAGVQLVASPDNTIGGAVAGAGNVISGNYQGIDIEGSYGSPLAATTIIQGNIIGANATGTASSNLFQQDGVFVENGANFLIGGTDPLARNIISGNQFAGIRVSYNFGFDPSTAYSQTIQGNYIGTDARGLASVGNQVGIYLDHDTFVQIGGTAPGAGNLISGNITIGIRDQEGYGSLPYPNTIQGNRIGTDLTGTHAVGNGRANYGSGSAGILLGAAADIVGGTAPGAGNVISGNFTDGIRVESSAGDVIQGNFVGTDGTGNAAIANGGDGIRFVYSNFTPGTPPAVGGTSAGAGNVIADNGGAGIGVEGTVFGISILSNSIHDNAGLGIDLGSDGVTPNDAGDSDTGPNDLQNFPAVIAAVNYQGMLTVKAVLDSTPNTTFVVQIFVSATGDPSGYGEGQTLLGTVNFVTDATGHAAATLQFPTVPGTSISATATATDGSTSEFGPSAAIIAGGPLVAIDDAYRVDTGTTLTVSPPGVLANDVDTNGNPFSAQYVAGPSHGVLTLNPDGSFSYTPNGTFLGVDTFTYRDVGIDGTSNIATVSITVASKMFVVTNTNDSGPGSLRQAILDANLASSPTPDTIRFRIPGTGPFLISPLTPLPAVSHPTIIDGYSQAGAHANTLAVGDNAVIQIQIGGVNPFDSTRGLEITGGGTTIKGLSITGFGQGIVLRGAGGDVIQGDFIGLAPQGNVAPNSEGIHDENSVAPLIGGPSLAARNVVSGNYGDGITLVGTAGTSFGAVVQDNYIGLGLDGNTPLGNSYQGIGMFDVSDSLIGGTAKNAGNVISANHNCGILVGGAGSTGNTFQGNTIGTDATGVFDRGNAFQGIYLGFWGDPNHYGSASNNLVGGTVAGAGNLISGNDEYGVWINGVGAEQNVVQGNLIGTDKTGTSAVGNSYDGVAITDSAANNLVGGTASGAGNVLSGNGLSGASALSGANHNVYQGNLIGVDKSGTFAIPNFYDGIYFNSPDNTVGGAVAGARNVISGNGAFGVIVQFASGTLIQGNYVGTDKTGTQPIGNGIDGVQLNSGASNSLVVDNLLSGNHFSGFADFDGVSNTVRGNLIGTDKTGTKPLGNSTDGVFLSDSSDTIGGTNLSDRNVIASNGLFGFDIQATSGAVVQGNLIGTDKSGKKPMGNGLDGVLLRFGSFGNLIGGTAPGAANVIAFNHGNGVAVGNDPSDPVMGNTIYSNQIHDNDLLGIDLGYDGVTLNDLGDGDSGPNGLQNFPVLNSVTTGASGTTISGTFNGAPFSTFILQFFSNTASDPSGYGEGSTLLDTESVNTDGDGNATFSFTLATKVPVGRIISATATSVNGDTSEFSADVAVTKALAPAITMSAASSGGQGPAPLSPPLSPDSLDLLAEAVILARRKSARTTS